VGDLLPPGTVAVLTLEQTESERTKGGGVRVLARDALTGLPDSSARPTPDEGIIRKGSWSGAGEVLVPAEPGPVPVTPAMVALAAAAGHDAIAVHRPPTVCTIVIGNALQAAGVPKPGRVREALGEAIPAYAMRLGARVHPTVRALDEVAEVAALVQDANADIIITTGALNGTRTAVADLGARWLLDGVAVGAGGGQRPSGAMVLARLDGDRVLIGLPGEPVDALVGAVALLGPVVGAMRGTGQPASTTAVLSTAAPRPARATDTALVPVSVLHLEGRRFATPLPSSGPAGLVGWARADAIAVVTPDQGYRDDPVELIPA
jgi:molybdopterin molybdotransferase